jgi:hypothetical protein
MMASVLGPPIPGKKPTMLPSKTPRHMSPEVLRRQNLKEFLKGGFDHRL